MTNNNTKKNKIPEYRRVLKAGTLLEGNFEFQDPVCVEGNVSGVIYSEESLKVATSAYIEAEAKAKSFIISGHFKGVLEAEDLVELCEGAHVEANIICKRIIIHEGAHFRGSVDQPKN